MIGHVVLCFGANRPGLWGEPDATLSEALRALEVAGWSVVRVSARYRTRAIGPHQPDFLNMVAVLQPKVGAAALLRLLKQLERAAGRRTNGRWSARALDIDIVSYGGAAFGWPHRRSGAITLPHPEAHRRAFVLIPLLSIAPHWHHAGLKMPGRRLLQRLPVHERRSVRLAMSRPQRPR